MIHRWKSMNFVAAFLALSLSAFPGQASAQAQDLDALIKAARAEGEMFFYTGAPENLAKRMAESYTATYGVKANFVRLPGVAVLQRFSSEADAGTFAADLFIYGTGARQFAREAIKKGWVESVSSAGIPAVRSGEFPARFLSEIAIVQVLPWGIIYNTEKVKPNDAPKDWTDILLPKYKGQIIMPEPRASDSYADVWALLLDKFGEQYYSRLREQNPRFASSAVPALNALAAGEGMLMFPNVGSNVPALVAKGAPIAFVVPDLTVGTEVSITLTHRSKAKHPSAARLFAHYAMSPPGNKIFNADPGTASVFDLKSLPKQYESADPDAARRMDHFATLLGRK